MKKTARIIMTAITLLGLWSYGWAISEGGAIFLMIRPGARPSGMGSAFSAIADDATATYYNPAGLANLKRQSPLLEFEEVKDWNRLLETLKTVGGPAAFVQEDILYSEGIVITLNDEPLLYRNEVADWPGLVEALKDTTNGLSRMLTSSLDQEQKDLLFRIKNGEPIEELVQDSLCWAFNRLINNARLFRQEGLWALQLPSQASEIIAKYRLVPDGKDFIPDNIIDPKALYKRLSEQPDTLSRSLYSLFPASAKLQFKKKKIQQLPDSMRIILAGGLNLALASAPQVSGSAVAKDGGDRMNNQASILSAYKGLLDISTGSPLPEENRELNRVLLEAAAKGKIKPWTGRFQSNPVVPALRVRLAAQLEQIMLQYNGETQMAEAEKRILLDGLNEAAAGDELQTLFSSDSLSLDPSVKMILEGLSNGNQIFRNTIIITHYLPGLVSPDRTMLSPMTRLRALAGPQFNAVLAQHTKGQPLDGQGRLEVLNGINSALTRREFYQETYWKGLALPTEARELLAEGVNNLSDPDLQKLNRLLLEKLLAVEIERLEREKRYATLMHSPWLSEIWADVGDMYYEYIAYAQPVKDWGVFGFNVIFISEGTSERTSVSGEYQGQFSSFEFSPCLSYGNQILDDLAGGVNLKLIHSHLAPFGAEGSQGRGVATSWALDFGALYKGPFRGMSLGANLQNIGPKLTYIDAEEADPLSRNIRAGMAYKILDGRLAKMTAAYDLTKMLVVTDRPWKEELKEAVHHMGVEYLYTGLATLGLRSGYVIDEVGQIKGPTFGLGVGYKNIQFDFGMEPGGELQKYNKKYSLSVEL